MVHGDRYSVSPPGTGTGSDASLPRDAGTDATLYFKDGFDYRSARCGDCVEAQCHAEASGCGDNPTCFAFAECLAACDSKDHVCRGRCAGISGAYDVPETTALQTCEAVHCAGLCNGLRVELPACDQCVADECPDALQTASTGGDQTSLTQCMLSRSRCYTRCNNTESTDLTCLGAVQWPPPATTELSLTLAVSNHFQSGSPPVVGLQVSACSELEKECGLSQPESLLGTTPLSFKAGAVEFGAHAERFFGHILITDPSGIYLPHLLYFFPYPIRDGSIQAGLLPQDLLTRIPVPVDSSLGVVFFDVYDCRPGHFASGVRFSIDDGPDGSAPVPVYYGYPPRKDQTETDSSSGLVWIPNVQPGLKTIDGTVGGKPFGTVHVWVEGGSVTTFHFVPTPPGI